MSLSLKTNWKLVFYLLAYAAMAKASTVCDTHTFNIGVSGAEIQWLESPISDSFISSNCLDNSYRLVYRQCVESIDGASWSPSNEEIESKCSYKMNNTPKECPSPYQTIKITGSSPRTICLRWAAYPSSGYPNAFCVKESLFLMGLNAEEIKQLAEQASLHLYGIMHQPARNMWPNTPISPEIDMDIIELQENQCGRHGLPLNVSVKDVEVTYCPMGRDCNLCLYLNVDDQLSKHLIIQECLNNRFPVSFDANNNELIRQMGCPEGYYRFSMGYYRTQSCFSLKMFKTPIPVVEIGSGEYVVESFCNDGASIMRLTLEEENHIFRKLSDKLRLTDGENCLFAMKTNNFIKYSEWEDSDVVDITVVSSLKPIWDKTMSPPIEDSYLTVKANGHWSWTADTVTCIACVIQPTLSRPKLKLKFSSLERMLELEVTDQKHFYWQNDSELGFICFAVIGDSYKANLTAHFKSEIIGKVGKYVIENVGTGLYWCSGHLFGDQESIIITEKFYAHGIIFAFRVERKCFADCSSTEEDALKDAMKQAQLITDIIDSSFESMKVENIPYIDLDKIDTNSDLTTGFNFTFHLTLTYESNSIENLDKNLMRLTEVEFKTLMIYEKLREIFVSDDSNETNIFSNKSTQYCLPESILSIDTIVWGVSNIDQTVQTSVLCPFKKTRTCTGYSAHGAIWEELINASECYSFVSELLLELHKHFRHANETSEVITNLLMIINDNVDNLLPIDVLIISHVFQKVSFFLVNNQSSIMLCDLENVFTIYNNLMKVNESVLKVSARLNSTNILLAFFDDVLLSHVESSIIDKVDYFNEGKISMKESLLMNVVLDPSKSNFSGIALYERRDGDINDFTNYLIRYIHPNGTMENVATESHLIIGTYVPNEILKKCGNMVIVLTIFFNDKLFQSNPDLTPDRKYFTVNGKVISINILGLNGEVLQGEIPIFFESNNTNSPMCGYWDFTLIEGWSSAGCTFEGFFFNDFHQYALCTCSHLTHFGYLISSDFEEFDKKHEIILTIITMIGGSTSMIGTMGIFITAITFKSWRKKLSSKILMNLSATIALQMSLLMLINFDDNFLLSLVTQNTLACVALGSAFHYSVLVMFFWMVIIAYIQFKRYVSVFNFNISRLLIKSVLFGWGIPLIFVIIVLCVDYSLYVPNVSLTEERKFCYPTGYALYYGLITPIGIIFSIDLLVLVLVVISLNRGLTNSPNVTENCKIKMRLSQVRLFAFLFFTLGMTWIFGFLSSIHAASDLVFAYLFCITATVQGLVLFLYFIILDGKVRNLWLHLIRKIFRFGSKKLVNIQ